MRLADPDGGPLLAWYDRHGRDLPWRRTREPYPVWVSEIMLQQTQVATVLPYYARWMEALPTIEALAACDDERLLSLWQGLGYYRRARMLRDGARFVIEQGWPTSASDWLKVPGVGPYTAAAIASICLGEASAVVDGNVERVYTRVCADGSTGSKLLKNARVWAQSQMFAMRPGDWNQAMMELGATICAPRNPKCSECPINDRCSARLSGREAEFPAKKPKPSRVELRFRIEVQFDGKKFGIRPVESARWWQGMWEFPTISEPLPHGAQRNEEGVGGEDTALSTPSQPPSSRGLQKGKAIAWPEFLGEFKHTVTHHRLTYSIDLVRTRIDRALRKASLEELEDIPLPAPQRKALRMATLRLGLPVD